MKYLGKNIKLLHKSCDCLCEDITEIWEAENFDDIEKNFDKSQIFSNETKKNFLKLKNNLLNTKKIFVGFKKHCSK